MKRYFNLFKSVVKDPLEAVVVLHIVSVLVGHQGSYKGLTVDPPDDEDMMLCITMPINIFTRARKVD